LIAAAWRLTLATAPALPMLAAFGSTAMAGDGTPKPVPSCPCSAEAAPLTASARVFGLGSKLIYADDVEAGLKQLRGDLRGMEAVLSRIARSLPSLNKGASSDPDAPFSSISLLHLMKPSATLRG